MVITRQGNWLKEEGNNFKVEGIETNNLNRFYILTEMIRGLGEENYLLWSIMAEIDRTRDWCWDFLFFIFLQGEGFGFVRFCSDLDEHHRSCDW